MTPAKSEPSVAGLNLMQRRIAARKAVNTAKIAKTDPTKLKWKEKESGALNFAYFKIEEMMAVIEPAQIEAGIVIAYDLSEEPTDVYPPWTVKTTYQNGDVKETRWRHIQGLVRVTMINADDPEDRAEITVMAEAKDNSDKAISKLYTMAKKNFAKLEYAFFERDDDTDSAGPNQQPTLVSETFAAPPKATEVTSDREPAVMADTIRKAYTDGVCKGTIESMMQTHGDDPLKWPSATLKQVYRAVVTKRRTMEASE